MKLPPLLAYGLGCIGHGDASFTPKPPIALVENAEEVSCVRNHRTGSVYCQWKGMTGRQCGA